MNIQKGQNPYYDTTTVQTTTLTRAFRFIVEALALRSILAIAIGSLLKFCCRRRLFAAPASHVRSAYWIRFLQGAGDIAVALQSELRNHVALFGKSACKCASEVRGAAIARDPVAWDVGSLFLDPFFFFTKSRKKEPVAALFARISNMLLYSYHLIHKIIIFFKVVSGRKKQNGFLQLHT